MKTIYFGCLLALCSIMACKQNNKEKIIETPKIVPTVMPKDLHGTWVKSAYVEDLTKTHSPVKSFDKLANIALFSFDTARLKGTKLIGGVSYNGHEGGACTVVFEAGKTPRSIIVQHIEGDTVTTPRELILENNELLFMAYLNNGSAMAEKYVRADDKNPPIDSALSYVARRIIFAGKWQAKEGTVHKTYDLTLHNDGKIEGLSNYVQYDIMTDFAAEPTPADYIFLFEKKARKRRTLQFKTIGRDTINLTERIKKKDLMVYQLTKPKKK